MRKILFLDIDNTLYSGRTGRVPDSALQAVETARRNGSLVFLCTGRSRAEASRYLNYPVDGFIFSSGTRCELDGRVIFDHPIDPAVVESIAETIRACDMGVLMGGAAGAYLDERCWREVENYFSRPEADPETKRRDMAENGMYPMAERDMKDPIYKMGATKAHGGSFEPLVQRLPESFRLIQTLSSPEGDFGDISDGSVMKRDGIRRVLAYLGEDIQNAVGIGDSENDLDMIQECGIGIAMGNASEAVKKAADWITSDIDEDGIWNAFSHLGII